MKSKIVSLLIALLSLGAARASSQESFSAPIENPASIAYSNGYNSVTESVESPLDAAAINYSTANHFLRAGNIEAALYFLGRAHAFVAQL